MSDCMILRRGGGGQGFDPNGAVLKVVTSTGCTVAVTNATAGYSKTHQQADGYPRSNNEDVTEHFFSIPASAFGTLRVVATNTYGDNTKDIAVNTAGKVYEALVSAPNILLNSEFGKQDGFSITASSGSATYDSDYKTYTLSASTVSGDFFHFSKAYDVLPYSRIRITSRQNSTTNTPVYSIYAKNKDGGYVFTDDLPHSTLDSTSSIALTDKDKTPFTFGFRKSQYNFKLIISEIVLE